MDQGWTYKDAGVDIDQGNAAVEGIKPFVKATYRPEVLSDLGGFGGLFALDKSKYENPVLVSGTDGVGTKLKLAFMADRHDTIGIDAVAMCANDILVSGAEPLFFLDYVAVGQMAPEKMTDIVKGVAEGCQQAGCALVGGEMAEMPGFYADGEYDIAGFCVGVVDRDKIIDGSDIQAGDTILGLASSGLHSNGYSLARKLVFDVGGMTIDQVDDRLGMSVGEALLAPTIIYAKAILPLLEAMPGKVKGMAHITGGGITENIPRILPEGVHAVLDSTTWARPPIFDLLIDIGKMRLDEAYRTFNMGLGYCLICRPEDAEGLMGLIRDQGFAVSQVGEVRAGEGPTQVQ